MYTNYRGLGFDPTPGRVEAVAEAAGQLRGAADAFGGVGPTLHEAEQAVRGWQGTAADAFRAKLAATPSDFADRAAALHDAAAALDRWAETLVANQRRAEELDLAAVRLRGQLEDARDTLQDKQNALDLAATPSATASASVEVAGANKAIADLEAALAEIIEKARVLERDHQRAADAVADELQAPQGNEPPAPRADEPVLRALSGVLGRASRTSSGLAGLLASPGGAPTASPSGAAAAFAGALSGPRPESTGELPIRGESPLLPGGET